MKQRGWQPRWLIQYWNPTLALVLAGILSAIYFGLMGGVWAVTGEFTRLGGHVLHLVGVDTTGWAYFDRVGLAGSTLARPDGWIVWGMFIGALMMVLLSGSFRIRVPQQKRRLVQGLVGGVIAGFGARLALGCNLAAFFTGVPQFSFHAWIFIVATGIGTWWGTRIVRLRWWKGRPNLVAGRAAPSAVADRRGLQPLLGALLALAYGGLTLYFFAAGQTRLGIAALFGLLFGILIERGQICFTSAFRDLWLMRRGVMAKAIIVGMAVSSVLTLGIIVFTDLSPITQVAAPSTFVGGVLFGLGIVMASSCETGMMYRLMEGQVLYLTVFVGNVAGATLLAYGWDHWGIESLLVASGESLNLITRFGPVMALFATLAMLALLYAATHVFQRGPAKASSIGRHVNATE